MPTIRLGMGLQDVGRRTQQAVPGPFRTLWRRWWGWEDGGMPDAVPPVDLASLTAGGGPPGALWRLDGEDLQANLVRLGRGDRIPPHCNDEVEVLMVVVSGRGELTLDGQVHQLAPMVVAHLPKGAVRAIAAVDGPLAYLSVHRRRPAGLQVGRPPRRP
jgi:quercetin dioxygenase-like cupin family protein